MLATNNFSVYHTLREGSHSVDFMAKLGAASDVDFVIHASPPTNLFTMLKSEATRVFFPRT